MTWQWRIKRWFGAVEKPLRPTVVDGIFEAATHDPRESSVIDHTTADSSTVEPVEIPNPFVDENRTHDWLPATVTIVEFSGSGTFIGPNELCRVTILITIANREPYRATTTQLISRQRQPTWVIGAERTAIVDPADHNRIVID
jgi:hypothetical protein